MNEILCDLSVLHGSLLDKHITGFLSSRASNRERTVENDRKQKAFNLSREGSLVEIFLNANIHWFIKCGMILTTNKQPLEKLQLSSYWS